MGFRDIEQDMLNFAALSKPSV